MGIGCGQQTFESSGYDTLTADYENYSQPIFFVFLSFQGEIDFSLNSAAISSSRERSRKSLPCIQMK